MKLLLDKNLWFADFRESLGHDWFDISNSNRDHAESRSRGDRDVWDRSSLARRHKEKQHWFHLRTGTPAQTRK
jgi:hypothetical protein